MGYPLGNTELEEEERKQKINDEPPKSTQPEQEDEQQKTTPAPSENTEPGKEEQTPKVDGKYIAKTVLITGCSEGGIGSALAFAFHRHGCQVFATARNLDKVQHLKNAGMQVLELDVLDEVSCKKAAEWVREATGGTLNILVNNSGVGMYKPPISLRCLGY